jgi:hypothetical protein
LQPTSPTSPLPTTRTDLGINEFSCKGLTGLVLLDAARQMQGATANSPFLLLRPQMEQLYLKSFRITGRKEGVSEIFVGHLEKTNVNLEMIETEFWGLGNRVINLTGLVTMALASSDNPSSFSIATPSQFTEYKARLIATFRTIARDLDCVNP